MNLNALSNWRIAPVEHAFSTRDTILYALGVGAVADPLNAASELRFVYEQNIQAIPTLACALANSLWTEEPALDINHRQLLHGEERIIWSRPMISSGAVRSNCRFLGVRDKGAHKGAVVYFEKCLYDCATELMLCVIRSTYFLRGDGGCGDYGEAPPRPSSLPVRLADRFIDLPTLPGQALIYRLSGDYNPLHADPAGAMEAGFDRPILHGLCTAGIACRGLINIYCHGDSQQLTSLFVRFNHPVYPGETLRLECFESGSKIEFRAHAVERNVIVLDCCQAEFRRD